jgi:hypothetical protein
MPEYWLTIHLIKFSEAMKKVFLTFAAILFAFAMSAQAPAGGQGQGRMGAGGMGRGFGGTPEEQVTRLEQTVTGLTADQKAKLVKVYTDAAAKRMAAYEKLGQNADREARTKVNNELTAAQDSSINAVLNDAQKAQYKKMQEERAARMSRFQSGAGAPGAGAPAGGGMPRMN